MLEQEKPNGRSQTGEDTCTTQLRVLLVYLAYVSRLVKGDVETHRAAYGSLTLFPQPWTEPWI